MARTIGIAENFAILLESQAAIDEMAGLDTTEIRAHLAGIQDAIEPLRSAESEDEALAALVRSRSAREVAAPSIRRAVRASAKIRNFKPKEGRA